MKFTRIYWFLICCFTTILAKGRMTRQADEDLIPLVRTAIRFLLWTRNNNVGPELLVIDDPIQLAKSNYAKTMPTRIYVPGLIPVPQNQAARLHDIDWLFTLPATQRQQMQGQDEETVKHSRTVGIVIAQFVNFLLSQGADLRGFHLIGFSIGVLVVAEAGRAANGTIPRITAVSDLGVPVDFTSDNIHFNLWTRSNPLILQELISGSASSLAASNFDATKLTKIFVHGWLMNGNRDERVLDMRDAFLVHEDCNFIAVDWELLAGDYTYYPSAANTGPVGISLGYFIDFLNSQGTTYDQFHVIGFSLGAHVSGKAGATVSGYLPRITGLDPALPGFSVQNTADRLDTTDARFVDVIHTNSGTLKEKRSSFFVDIGHVDFWPNGGMHQPGCPLPGIESDLIDFFSACSHHRAREFFMESINGPTPFTSTRCVSYDAWRAGQCNGNPTTLMGLPVFTTATGNYSLDTNSKALFARG